MAPRFGHPAQTARTEAVHPESTTVPWDSAQETGQAPVSTMSVEYATLFNNVMSCIWGDNTHDFVVRALADKVRGTARINPENALEVLDLFGPDIVEFMDARASDAEDDRDTALFTIRFNDNSSILIVAKRGIGSAIEMI